jgi:glycosyltransferase involved in cell wall biosynthesis
MEEPKLLNSFKHEYPIKVAFLGGDSDIKGFKIILECLTLLHPNIVIFMAGSLEHPEINYDRPNLKYVGIFKNVYDLLVQSDILFCPSTVPHFAIPIIEAGRCKIPVIASNVEGMDEIVKSGVNGLLFEKGNSKHLAEYINLLAENSQLREEYGIANYNLVVSKFSVESNMPLIENIYFS